MDKSSSLINLTLRSEQDPQKVEPNQPGRGRGESFVQQISRNYRTYWSKSTPSIIVSDESTGRGKMRGARRSGGAASDSQTNLLPVGFSSYRSGHARKSGDSHSDIKEKRQDPKDERYQDDRDHDEQDPEPPSPPELLPAMSSRGGTE